MPQVGQVCWETSWGTCLYSSIKDYKHKAVDKLPGPLLYQCNRVQLLIHLKNCICCHIVCLRCCAHHHCFSNVTIVEASHEILGYGIVRARENNGSSGAVAPRRRHSLGFESTWKRAKDLGHLNLAQSCIGELDEVWEAMAFTTSMIVGGCKFLGRIRALNPKPLATQPKKCNNNVKFSLYHQFSSEYVYFLKLDYVSTLPC